MKRLFFALWPDEPTCQQCVEIQNLLLNLSCKPVAMHNLHVTLVFLGNVDAAKEMALLEAATTISARQIQIIFDQLSFWNKPKVLCLTSQVIDSELSNLVKELTNVAKNLAIAVDERLYTPHVTLARKANQTVNLTFEPIIWRANQFCLVESCSTITGVEYRICQTWPK